MCFFFMLNVFKFNPAHCKWECLPDMASPRDYFAAVCWRGKVYSVEYYTPEDNTWRYSFVCYQLFYSLLNSKITSLTIVFV